MALTHDSSAQLYHTAQYNAWLHSTPLWNSPTAWLHHTALLHNSSTGPTTQLYYTTLLQGPLHSSTTQLFYRAHYTTLLQGPLHSSTTGPTTQLYYRAHYTALLHGSTRFAYAYIHTYMLIAPHTMYICTVCTQHAKEKCGTHGVGTLTVSYVGIE